MVFSSASSCSIVLWRDIGGASLAELLTHIFPDTDLDQLQPILSLYPGDCVVVESERVSPGDILRVCVSWRVSRLEVFSLTLATTMTRRHT